MTGRLSEIVASRELLWNLTLRELRSKYKRSALGWAWSLLNPLAVMGIFSLVFSLVLRVEPPVGDPSGLYNYALFLLCGLLPFNLLSNGVTAGMGSLVANASLVKKVYFPREILIGASVSSWIFSFLIELSVLGVALLIAGNVVVAMIPLVLATVALQAVFVLGLALILGVTSVYFRDLEHLTGIGLQVWFYATPVIYPITYVTDRVDEGALLLRLYELNPMVGFVEVYRNLLYDLRLPAAGNVAYLVGVSLLSLIIGLATFKRFDARIAEEL